MPSKIAIWVRRLNCADDRTGKWRIRTGHHGAHTSRVSSSGHALAPSSRLRITRCTGRPGGRIVSVTSPEGPTTATSWGPLSIETTSGSARCATLGW